MKARGRLADGSGFTLSEMLVVLAILSIVLAAMAQLFVSAMRTEVDQTKRFQAQQEGRLALDALRREIHCANAVSPTTGFPVTSITITLGSYCTTSGGSVVNVLWCTTGSSAPYSLWRTTQVTCTGGVKKAGFLTTNLVFTGLSHPSGERAKLSIRLPIDAYSAAGGGLYELQDDIVLRNTSR